MIWNKKAQTPFDLIKSYPEKPGVLIWGDKNYWRKTWDFFQSLIDSNPNIEDPEHAHDIVAVAMRGVASDLIWMINEDSLLVNVRN